MDLYWIELDVWEKVDAASSIGMLCGARHNNIPDRRHCGVCVFVCVSFRYYQAKCRNDSDSRALKRSGIIG